MFGRNRARAKIAVLDEQIAQAKRQLHETNAAVDKALTGTAIQEMVRRALARVEEANRRAPPTS